jgi:predicted choloylglycine hydrolase
MIRALKITAERMALSGVAKRIKIKARRERKPLLGRSYEMAPNDEDRILITSRINRRAKSIGLSTIIFGRLEGINEHGLAATMSVSIAPPQRENSKGFDFWVFMRAVLDTCYSVAEALNLLREFLPT